MVVKQHRGYDIIGDVHGCATSLETLLQKLGYVKKQGIYQHPERLAVFVGDIVDRGPAIREACHLVRDMVVNGFAQMVMGNHEYNAIGYTTQDTAKAGSQFLRVHTERHTKLIQETLDQFAHHTAELEEFVQWFLTLPLFLEFEQFRVVHACWDHRLITQLKEQFPTAQVDLDFMRQCSQHGSFAQQCVERLLRGTDMVLPDNESISGADGFTRRFFRTKFWVESPTSYHDIVFQPDALPAHIAERNLSQLDKQRLVYYSQVEPALFIGHYWLQGPPQLLTANIACLDYSAVKDGKLVAYRWNRGDLQLKAKNFVWVDVNQELA